MKAEGLAAELARLEVALATDDPDRANDAEFDCHRLGRELTAEQVDWLEEQIRQGQHPFVGRIVLLGHYTTARNSKRLSQTRLNHILWLIEQRPECYTAGSPFASVDAVLEEQHYRTAKDVWLRQCQARATDARVLANAAQFFLIFERDRAEQLLLAAQQIDPTNPDWHEHLAHLYSLAASSRDPESKRDRARKSLLEYETADQLRQFHRGAADEEQEAFAALLHSLPARARQAFDAGEFQFAREYAEECLRLAGDETTAEYKRDGDAWHQGHLVLGRLALLEGRIADAKTHLLESGRKTSFCTLVSFGPNMSLAKDLLKLGERDVVLEYFDLCAKFWKCGGDRLDAWKQQVQAGRIPAFGANLNY